MGDKDKKMDKEELKLKAKKLILEEEIRNRLNIFINDTGLRIEGIEIEREPKIYKGGDANIAAVILDVRL